jgi:DNA polymerase I-like protein with 3'-5' exonuclease and polymerase domains
MNLRDLFEQAHTEEEKRSADAAMLRDQSVRESLRRQIARIPEQRVYNAMTASVADWQPPDLPQLDQFDEVFIDLETDGLRWWGDNRMIGAGVGTPDGRTRYLPIRHKSGPNIPEAQFFEWCRRELRGKRIVNIRTKFDLHMFRAEDIDLEAQGNTFGDVAHYAGLLDDHRQLFNQEDLALAYLAGNGLLSAADCKVKAAHGYDLDPTKFAEYPAGLVAPRAEGDVRIVQMLQTVMWPLLTEQGLHTVREIEDQVIPVVVEMEHNGAPIDVELLDDWVRASARDLDNLRHAIKRATQIEFEKFTKRDTQLRLFRVLGIEPPLDPESPRDEQTGEPHYSFADALLKPIKNRWIQALRAGLQLESLRSKFLLKYQRSVAHDGILRYELHQMPYQKDKGTDGEETGGGAVSGRFSSAAPNRQEGANIQQVFGADAQKKNRAFTRKYIVKKLFVTGTPGVPYVNADANSLQFRIFAHYADDPKIIAAYQRDQAWREIEARGKAKLARGEKLTKDDKLTDFHQLVGDLILEYAHQELTRTHTKNVNFAQVFGAGVRKMAAQLGVPADQIPSFDEKLSAGGPRFKEVLKISETYHTMFPSVKPLLALTSHLAVPEHKSGERGCGHQCREFCNAGYPHRGWVRTFLGRRARFNRGDRFYSALNRIIQGTEADVIKRILVEVHKRRQELGLVERFTVHDALAGDLHGDPAHLKEVLNTQYYAFKVPILWEVGVGKTWADAK